MKETNSNCTNVLSQRFKNICKGSGSKFNQQDINKEMNPYTFLNNQRSIRNQHLHEKSTNNQKNQNKDVMSIYSKANNHMHFGGGKACNDNHEGKP